MTHAQADSCPFAPPRWYAVPLGTAILALILASQAAMALTPAGLAYPAGAAAGFLPVALAVVRLSRYRLPGRGFGPANATTLARGVVAGLLAGLIAAPETLSADATRLGWLPALLVGLCLLLDLADGRLARSRNQVSEFGARFDLEVDAWTVLVLSVLVVALGRAPQWVLAIGLLHYLFRAAALALPALSGPLPTSLRRRLIGGSQALVLGTLLAPPLPDRVAPILAGTALAALVLSFAIDTCRLWRAPLSGR